MSEDQRTMSDEPWTITPEIQTGLSVNARGSLIPTDQLRELVHRVTKADAILASLPQARAESFQAGVMRWAVECFGPVIPLNLVERGDRLLVEVFELLQSDGYYPAHVKALCDYVWSRPVGEPHQELGGVMVTLAAYAEAHGLDMKKAGDDELARVWTKVEAIRAKQAAKPTGSALPIAADPLPQARAVAHPTGSVDEDAVVLAAIVEAMKARLDEPITYGERDALGRALAKGDKCACGHIRMLHGPEFGCSRCECESFAIARTEFPKEARAVGDEEVERACIARQNFIIRHPQYYVMPDWNDMDLVAQGIHRGAMRAALATLPPAPKPDEMVAFGASEMACVLYPGEDQQALRAAFIDGASRSVAPNPKLGSPTADSPLPPAPGWRGIESAPKDRFVIVFCPNAMEEFQVGEAIKYDNGEWFMFGCNGGRRISPTHWQPLPSPPSPSEPEA